MLCLDTMVIIDWSVNLPSSMIFCFKTKPMKAGMHAELVQHMYLKGNAHRKPSRCVARRSANSSEEFRTRQLVAPTPGPSQAKHASPSPSCISATQRSRARNGLKFQPPASAYIPIQACCRVVLRVGFLLSPSLLSPLLYINPPRTDSSVAAFDLDHHSAPARSSLKAAPQ